MQKHQSWFQRVYQGFAILFLAVSFAILGLIGWAYLRGGRILAVQTGSMLPAVAPHDALIITKHNPQQLRVGQVITYQNSANPSLIVSHRLISIDKSSGWLTTKGDALSRPDPPIPPRLVTGKALAIAPGLGGILDELHTLRAMLIFIYIPALLLLIYEARRLAHSSQLTYSYNVRL